MENVSVVNSGGNDGKTNSTNFSRKVIASKSFRPGDIVMRCHPSAVLLHPSMWSERCSFCFETGINNKKLLRCSKCKLVYYCSQTCQKKDWRDYLHRKECPVLPQLIQEVESPADLSDVLLLGRIRRGKHDISTLCFFEKDFNQSLCEIALSSKLVPRDGEKSSLQKDFSRFHCNNFGVTDDLLVNIAAGVYVNGALVNHSCDCNCVITYDPLTHVQTFRSLRNIACGEEITHSYIDVATSSRRKILQDTYHFTCQCVRCIDDLRELSNDDCPGAKDIVRQAELSDDIDDEINLLNQVLVLRKKTLNIRNQNLLSVHGALMSAYIVKADYSNAIQYALSILDTYQWIYDPIHPLVGLHLYTLGDLLTQCSNDFPDLDGRKILLQAKDILTTTHGKDHRLVKGLINFLST